MYFIMKVIYNGNILSVDSEKTVDKYMTGYKQITLTETSYIEQSIIDTTKLLWFCGTCLSSYQRGPVVYDGPISIVNESYLLSSYISLVPGTSDGLYYFRIPILRNNSSVIIGSLLVTGTLYYNGTLKS